MKPIDPGVKFIVLMHPWEAYKQRTGTGRLTALGLENAEIIITANPDENQNFRDLLNTPEKHTVVLYPGEDASTAACLPASDKQLQVLLIDATWALARKMMHRSDLLQSLPKLSFTEGYRSRFAFKTQPAEYCLSTIESAYYLLKELQDAGHCSMELPAENLLNPFKELIRFQLDCEEKKNAPPSGGAAIIT